MQIGSYAAPQKETPMFGQPNPFQLHQQGCHSL